MLNSQGAVKISDFGISSQLESTGALCETFVGTTCCAPRRRRPRPPPPIAREDVRRSPHLPFDGESRMRWAATPLHTYTQSSV
eukprot:4745619-Prymnesium_polylepis.2